MRLLREYVCTLACEINLRYFVPPQEWLRTQKIYVVRFYDFRMKLQNVEVQSELLTKAEQENSSVKDKVCSLLSLASQV